MYRNFTVFSNKDDSLVAEYRLHAIGLDVLQQLWHRPSDDPMPDIYAVEEWMMLTLRQYMDTDIEFDPSGFAYFVEATADFVGEEIAQESQSGG